MLTLLPTLASSQPVSDSLLREVGQWAGQYPHETALCLEEDNYTVPTTNAASPSGLASDRCEDAVAFWHTHPRQGLENGRFRVFYRRQTGEWPDESRDACYLSEKDVQTARTRSVPWIIVAVDADTYCWWSHEQIDEIEPVQPLNRPPAGQTSWNDDG